jgi:hypothetical protein
MALSSVIRAKKPLLGYYCPLFELSDDAKGP